MPGLFWYMDRSPEQMREFEPNLMAKLSGDYQFATSPELRDVIVGFNPWHYKNRPTCAQDWCCRGAEGFGNLTALATAIARNSCGGCLPSMSMEEVQRLASPEKAGDLARLRSLTRRLPPPLRTPQKGWAAASPHVSDAAGAVARPALSGHPHGTHAGLARRRNRAQRPGDDAGVTQPSPQPQPSSRPGDATLS